MNRTRSTKNTLNATWSDRILAWARIVGKTDVSINAQWAIFVICLVANPNSAKFNLNEAKQKSAELGGASSRITAGLAELVDAGHLRQQGELYSLHLDRWEGRREPRADLAPEAGDLIEQLIRAYEGHLALVIRQAKAARVGDLSEVADLSDQVANSGSQVLKPTTDRALTFLKKLDSGA